MGTPTLPSIRFMCPAFQVTAILVSSCGAPDKTNTDSNINICHRTIGNPDDAIIINIPASELTEHMSHGDSPAPCGALVRVTMNSTVGVLLDELPQGARDRAAAALLAEDEEFWSRRVADQLHLTLYQLTLRQFFYINREDPAGSLWLPPEALWNIAFDSAGAERRVIDGHDYIAVDYTFTGTLLSDAESTCAAEPELCDVGGMWNEIFTLPVDAEPQLMTARLRYACICEDGVPSHSIFGPTAWFFYNQYTPSCTEDEFPCACHVTEPTGESCKEAVGRHIGGVTTAMRFERIIWDGGLADQARYGELAETPELVAQGTELSDTWLTYRYIAEDSCEVIESCVRQPGWRRVVNFSGNALNAGREPLVLGEIAPGNPYVDNNAFHLSECHGHYHFNHYADYRLGDALDHKQGFCLIGTSRLTNTEDTPLAHPFTSCEYQGIPAGWGDEYVAGLSCQWVDVTDLDTSAGAVTEPLEFALNPHGFLCEGRIATDTGGEPIFENVVDGSGQCMFRTELGECEGRPVCESATGAAANNVVSHPVTIPVEGGMVTEPCTRDVLGPRRDCGFLKEDAHIACTPGESVSLSCAQSDPSGAPQVLRICETSRVLGHGTACEALHALANTVIEPGAAIAVELTCPDRRDDSEPGGEVAVYVAPLLPGDPPDTVLCTIQ